MTQLERSSWWRREAVRLGTLAACLTVLVVTFPSQGYPGDAAAIRHVARHLAFSGEWGIPRDDADRLAQAFVRPTFPNQYLFDNPATARLHSRWGELNTLVFALPFLVERAAGLRTEASMDMAGPALRLHGAMSVALGLVLAGLLFGVARRLGASEGACAVFTLGTMFSGCTWHFIRAPVSEGLQIVVVAALARWAAMAAEAPRRWDGVRAGVLLVLLLHAKVSLVVLMLPCAWLLWRRGKSPGELWALCGVVTAGVLTVLWVQAVKFGSPLQPGIGALDPGETHHAFSLRHVPAALADFTVGPNRSVWMFHPVLAAAVASFHVAWRERRWFTGWLAGSILAVMAVVCSFENWTGEWTVGPRHLAALLAVAGLPAALMFTRIARARAGAASRVAAALVLLLLGSGAWAQWTVARFPYLAYPALRAAFGEFGSPAARAYFDTNASPLVMHEFRAFVADGFPFFPLEASLGAVAPQSQRLLLRTIATTYRSNMLFVDLPPPAVAP